VAGAEAEAAEVVGHGRHEEDVEVLGLDAAAVELLRLADAVAADATTGRGRAMSECVASLEELLPDLRAQ
jgi:hypothetical protein